MAQIVINEVSQNYTYNIGTNSFATVALPMTACWGPGFFDPKTTGVDMEDMLEYTAWERFPATQAGLESFVSTYRGPAANYRLARDYSYQMAMTLLTAGYDVLVCRMSPGTRAAGQIKCQSPTAGEAILRIQAKYPGTFGNTLRVELKKFQYRVRENGRYVPKYYWNLITSIIDDSGIKTSVENKTLVFDIDNATDTMPYYDEVDSDFITLSIEGKIEDAEGTEFISIDQEGQEIPEGSRLSALPYTDLAGGTDKAANPGTGSEAGTPVVTDQNLFKYYIEVAQDSDANGNIKTTLADLYDKAYNGEEITEQPIVDEAQVDDAVLGGDSADALDKITEILESIKTDEAAGLAAVINTVEGAEVTEAGAQTLIDKKVESTGEAAEYIQLISDAVELAEYRYDYVTDTDDHMYPGALAELLAAEPDVTRATNIKYMEWLYTYAVGVKVADGTTQGVYDLLKDKLTYNPNRIISPGWDDQNIMYITDDDTPVKLTDISPLNLKIMDVAYYSRCATGMIDIPKSLGRAYVYNEELDTDKEGYVQKLARYIPDDTTGDVNGTLYQSHSAIFAPWGKYTYVGTSKQSPASPSFLALMIQRAQILNQANQFEWALPTNRKHNLRIGKMDYNVPKKYLDVWQTLEGVGVNVITNIPDLGTNIWGNSTLFETPPATYQALANLSTRYLVNAVEDVIYRVGIGITFSYNNEQAYNKFYAGCTPILDTMKNVGAIEDYYVRMSADINGLDHVNANTVIGKVYLVVNGVINDIVCDLIALPPGVDLNQFKG